ncbi:MAG TPA: ATP-binding protein [bacterium]|nr:ATP-binding protein [bacterium]HQG44056.1 ATP-binding protein [bacterium]HQI48789.1 ATP-binding protein [bacterium]HQJ63564.1 ATP-binding protein [bacterium]
MRTASVFFYAVAWLLAPLATVRPQNPSAPLVWSAQGLPRLDNWAVESNPSHTVHDFILEDFDGDGQLELCELRTEMNHPLFLAILELSRAGYTYPGHPIALDPYDQVLFTLGGRGRFRFATYRRAGEKGWIDLYDHKAVRVDSLTALGGRDGSGDGLWTGKLIVLPAVDLNGDDRPDLVALVNTGADGGPRAVLAYDLATRERLLEVHFAPMVSQVLPVDGNGDGATELVISLAGASDGPQFGPFSRDSSYIAVLGCDGRLLAHKAFGGESSYVNVQAADTDGDGQPEILAAPFSLVLNHQRAARLYALDGCSLAVKSELENAAEISPLNQLIQRDLNGDGTPEFITSDLTGHAAVISYDPGDTRFKVLSLVKTGGEASLQLADDVNLDGTVEIFITTANPPALWLTDAALHPLAWMPIKDPYHFKIAAHTRLLAARPGYSFRDGTALYQLQIGVNELLPGERRGLLFLGKRVPSETILFFLLALLLLILPGLLFLALALHRTAGFADRLSSARVGFAMVNAEGRIVHCNPRFLKMIDQDRKQVLKQPADTVLRTSRLEGLLLRYQTFSRRGEVYEQHEIEWVLESRAQTMAVEFFRIRSYASFILLLLIDLSESLEKERLKIWAAMAQRMAHKTKTPLATVLLAIQRLQRNYKKNSPERVQEYDEMTRTALHEIERVRDSINAFMKFARLEPPVLVLDDFSRVVQECLQEYLPRIPDEVQLQTSFETLELPVAIDISQFKEAFYNLLDNAISAIQGDGILGITTMQEKDPLSGHGKGDQALLEITDNGKGISAADFSRLFKAGFSTSRSGTGMGLPLARSIIEAHDGTIEIDSHEGSGTTVFVRLPIR